MIVHTGCYVQTGEEHAPACKQMAATPSIVIQPASQTLTPMEKHQREFSGIFSKRRADLSFLNSGDRKLEATSQEKSLESRSSSSVSATDDAS